MVKSSPILSIILPVYNAEKFVAEAIESVLNQTFKDFELIIVDDRSEDNSIQVIENYSNKDKRIVLFINSINRGKVATVNHVIKYAKGEYITIHDADDVSHPLRFEKQILFLEENQDFGMCGTNFISFKNNVVLYKSKLQTNWNEIKKLNKEESQFHGPTVIFKKCVLEKLGEGYRNYFIHGEDIDFTVRIVENFKSSNLSEYLYFYRLVGTSLTKKVCFFNERRFLNTKLIFFLAEERRLGGIDSLMKGDISFLTDLLDEWGQNVFNDKTHALRLGASYNMGQKMYINAILLSYMALRRDPFNILNLKCLLYCIRKAGLDFLFDFFTEKEKVSKYLEKSNVFQR